MTLPVLSTNSLPIGAQVSLLDTNQGSVLVQIADATAGIVELPPGDLVLHELSDQAIFNVQPPALVFLNEQFTDPSLARFTFLTEGVLGTPSIAGGAMTIAGAAGGDKNTLVLEGAGVGMPQGMISVNVVSRTGAGGNAYENVGIGLCLDANNFVYAVWRSVDTLASIQIKVAGAGAFHADVSAAGWALPFELGVSIVASSVVMWRRTPGDPWEEVTSYDATPQINLKTTVLTNWRPSFAVATESAVAVSFRFNSFLAGRFGGVSIRDLVIVSNEDGSPRLTGSTVSLTATCCDPKAAGYCAVLTLDLLTRVLTQTGVIMVSRGGAVQNDSAAHAIGYDDGTFRLLITSWGNAGTTAAAIQILYKRVAGQDLLNGANIVAGMAQLNLPLIPALGGCYDPYAVFTAGAWFLAYTIGPNAALAYYPALATTNDFTAWAGIGSDPGAVPYEGTRIVELAGVYWVLTANIDGSNVYDLSMVNQGKCATLAVAGPNYPAHPMLVPYLSYVYQVTFDDQLFDPGSGPVANTVGHFRLLRARRYGVTAP